MDLKGYTPTIGLEVHAELNTQTKMFCDSRNSPRESRPNVNVCPVCMAHPGTLPVINKQAVRHVLRVGAALGGRFPDYTEFDRKNYFYPDIPKGYQISQYKYPLVEGGSLLGVAITRVHLEEDTARSLHDAGEGTRIDYNRAGVPLMELVTEPVIHDAQTAGAFGRELQLLLRTLGASEANMEEGQMRVEVNISVSKDTTFGTKVEIKNINSFRSVERAIEYEVARQIEALESGSALVQETRGWDENEQKTFSQRKKESSHDYRYFPDPDLPKLRLSEMPEFLPETLRAEMPELPFDMRARYSSLGLKKEDVEMFVRDRAFGGFFDRVTADKKELAAISANYIASDIAGAIQNGELQSIWMNDEKNISRFSELMELLQTGALTSRAGKNILTELFAGGGKSPSEIATEQNLFQKSDRGELEVLAGKIISAHPAVVADYKAGKAPALQFLIGQGMKESKGSANPGTLKEVFEKLLS